VLARLARMAEEALDVVVAEGRTAVGVAVAVPGVVEAQTGTLLRAPNLGWSELPIADEIGRRLPGLPVRADNEANLAAVAEHWQGAGRDLENFVCVFGEVGVGGGIFVGGELFRGAHGYGGELGHIIVDPAGPPCNCGSQGCLETFVGQEAIARRAGIDAGSGRTRSLTRELVRRAEDGDPAVLESLSETGRYLGIGLASAVNLLDVDVVVLGGCFGPLAPWLVDDVSRFLGERVLSAAWSGCEVRASELGEGAAVRGAAALVLRSVLAEPWLVAERSSRRMKVS
jgi:predicted NBD/HSP70 family sugar kinase